MFLKSVALFVNIYLQFVFVQAQLIVVHESYMINGEELTNMLPHIRAQLRTQLSDRANDAIDFAADRLDERNIQSLNFREDQKHFIFDFYLPTQAGNVQHLFTDQQRQVFPRVYQNGHANGHPSNEYNQSIKLYGNGVIRQEYSIMWERKENGEKIEYKEITFLDTVNESVIFKQLIVYTDSNGEVLTIEQTNKKNYKINN
ncbi:hypothetical protein ACQ4LE_008748 [Meloidogyne hapla]|uniref:FTP domain-containing protein n=1 Tax=Meloidogyne hapla TaxID=6305 RepID=A0A1I8BQL0_MELHA